MCNNLEEKSNYCGPYTLNDVTSIKQFAQDYANEISLYMDDFVYTKEVHQSPSLKMLVSFAEKEFHREFSKPPTYAVYAPGCVNLCGESEDFNDGKILSMATQLVTVIVGTRRATSRVCKIKTLLREKGEENYAKFSINTSGLDTSSQVTWVNYVKAVIRNFRVSKEYIPGFKALIVSSIPIKRGLGSSSALIVAMYTLLEAITKVYTTNTLEKSIACQQAEKIAMSVSCGIWKTLLPIVGIEGKVMEFDSRLLEIQEHVWSPLDIDLIFINSTEDVIDTLVYQKYLNQCREVAFALNLISLRDATIPKLAIVGQLFSSSSLKAACHVINETDRVTTAGQLIDHCHWKKLGFVISL
ncbi:galactokinase-like [Neodiprion pinetum]|uniref:galactokinase-like n=1 Tax=Neodiprion pinetum TaxID=441929 RepID=UPI001EE05F1F|nr:galactokinase-like [Neodiprion pinetum]